MDAGFHTVKMAPFLLQDVLAEVLVFHSSEVLVTAETLADSPMKLEDLLLMLPELVLLECVTLGNVVNANVVILAAFLMMMLSKIWFLSPTNRVIKDLVVHAMPSNVVNVTVVTTADSLMGNLMKVSRTSTTPLKQLACALLSSVGSVR